MNLLSKTRQVNTNQGTHLSKPPQINHPKKESNLIKFQLSQEVKAKIFKLVQ